MNFTVTQNGKPFTNYNFDEDTLTFSTTEDNLVIDFGNESHITFITGDDCTFKTGASCTFNTGDNCTFKTGHYCTFNTGDFCTFNTDFDCTFTTGYNCVGIRYDVRGIIEIPENKTIKYNDYEVPGFTYVEPEKKKVTLELTDEQLEKVKEMIR